jgi:ClpA/ClpB-like protein
MTSTHPRWKDEPVFERFTDRARRALVLAQEEAGLLNHGFIGTEHILLGLVAESDGLAAKALESLNISLDAVRERVREIIGPAPSSTPDSRPFTPLAKKALELSLREALQLGHNYIGTEHLLLGVVREGDGVGAQVLVSLGADLNRVRAAVLDSLSAYESKSGHAGARLGSPGAGAGADADVAWEAAWSAAGARRVGKEWLVEVVRAGRRPVDYANAYRELAELLEAQGQVLDDLDAGEIFVMSVETSEGPGLKLSVKHRIEDETATDPGEKDPPSS